MARFRRMKTLQKFSAVHAFVHNHPVHNHVNRARHPTDRQICKAETLESFPRLAASPR